MLDYKDCITNMPEEEVFNKACTYTGQESLCVFYPDDEGDEGECVDIHSDGWMHGLIVKDGEYCIVEVKKLFNKPIDSVAIRQVVGDDNKADIVEKEYMVENCVERIKQYMESIGKKYEDII